MTNVTLTCSNTCRQNRVELVLTIHVLQIFAESTEVHNTWCRHQACMYMYIKSVCWNPIHVYSYSAAALNYRSVQATFVALWTLIKSTVRVQGPFNPPEEVRRLKFRPSNPTLCVATDYYCEDMRRQVDVSLIMIAVLFVMTTCSLLLGLNCVTRNGASMRNSTPSTTIAIATSPWSTPACPYQGHISYSLRGLQPDKDIHGKPF